MSVYKQEAVPVTAYELAVENLQTGDCAAAIKNLKYTANAHQGSVLAGKANYMLGMIFEENSAHKDKAQAQQAFHNAAILGISEALLFYTPRNDEVLDLEHFEYWDYD